MSGNVTFTIIKPDAVKSGHSGSIIKMIEKAGFKKKLQNFMKYIKKNLSMIDYVIICHLDL